MLSIQRKKLLVLTLGSLMFLSCFGLAAAQTVEPEKNMSYKFQDGTQIKVHYSDAIIRESEADTEFPRRVLDAAVFAYQTITEFEGFSSKGYSFASPDKSFAFDPDQTIDIFIGNPDSSLPYQVPGGKALSFKDAPCFDTAQLSSTQYQALILLPGRYRQFIKNWESMNPSTLGPRNVDVDLRGTLIHEMTHAILFYYNKNLNKNSVIKSQTTSEAGVKVDWFVEGLARYFETFAGARHDFFSQGFKEMLPDKIRFSRGGSNYFMRYPDQPFTDLRYENALFWRFLDYQKGMSAIEALSRELRVDGAEHFEEALRAVTGYSIQEFLQKFSLAALFNDFGLKGDSAYLKEIAKTRLLYKKDGFYLKDGFGHEQLQGPICRTDWVGQWENEKASFQDPAAAGDSTSVANVAGWATDFYEITFDKGLTKLPWIGVELKDGEGPILVQAVFVSKGGSRIFKTLPEISLSQKEGLSVDQVLRQEGLVPQDLEKAYLLITNSSQKQSARYEVIS